MTATAIATDDRLLPPAFADLEGWARQWNVQTTNERNALRTAKPMSELVAFYEAMLARTDDALAHLDQFELGQLPAPEQRLFGLLCALAEASIAVEVFESPAIANSEGRLDLKLTRELSPVGPRDDPAA